MKLAGEGKKPRGHAVLGDRTPGEPVREETLFTFQASKKPEGHTLKERTPVGKVLP